MFLRKKWIELFKTSPDMYGNIDQIFYAIRRFPPITKQDLWKATKAGEAESLKVIRGHKDHEYFVINTAVGIGAKGRNSAKMVHIRFRLIPIFPGIRDPEVISLYLHSISERAGSMKISEQTEKVAGIAARSPPGFLARLSGSLSKNIRSDDIIHRSFSGVFSHT